MHQRLAHTGLPYLVAVVELILTAILSRTHPRLLQVRLRCLDLGPKRAILTGRRYRTRRGQTLTHRRNLGQVRVQQIHMHLRW